MRKEEIMRHYDECVAWLKSNRFVKLQPGPGGWLRTIQFTDAQLKTYGNVMEYMASINVLNWSYASKLWFAAISITKEQWRSIGVGSGCQTPEHVVEYTCVPAETPEKALEECMEKLGKKIRHWFCGALQECPCWSECC